MIIPMPSELASSKTHKQMSEHSKHSVLKINDQISKGG